MKPQILKRVLLEALRSQLGAEPTELDKKSFKIARSSYRISIASLFIAVLFGVMGIYFVVVQIGLTHKQMDTDTKIHDFDSLLKVTQKNVLALSDIQLFNAQLVANSQKQIEQLITTNKSINEQIKVLKRQFNMNADRSNYEAHKLLLEQSNEYNDLAMAMNNLEPVVNIYRQSRNKNILLSTDDVNYRLQLLDTISKTLDILQRKAAYLMPFKNLSFVMDSSLNSLALYKIQCINYRQYTHTDIDSTALGKTMFSNVIYAFLNLEDSIGMHINEYRDMNIKALRDLEKLMDKNSKKKKL